MAKHKCYTLCRPGQTPTNAVEATVGEPEGETDDQFLLRMIREKRVTTALSLSGSHHAEVYLTIIFEGAYKEDVKRLALLMRSRRFPQTEATPPPKNEGNTL